MHRTVRGPSRTAISCGFAALVLLAAPGRTLHASPCLEPVEKSAFEIRALQSHLMVMALTCGQHDGYNAFVTRHRQQLLGSYEGVTRHFARLHGAAGEQQRDSYVTELANHQSHDAIQQGQAFCQGAPEFFQRAVEQFGPGGTGSLLLERRVVNSYAPGACTAPAQQMVAAPPVANAPAAARPVAKAPVAAPPAANAPAADPRDQEIARLRAQLQAMQRSQRQSPRPAPAPDAGLNVIAQNR